MMSIQEKPNINYFHTCGKILSLKIKRGGVQLCLTIHNRCVALLLGLRAAVFYPRLDFCFGPATHFLPAQGSVYEKSLQALFLKMIPFPSKNKSYSFIFFSCNTRSR